MIDLHQEWSHSVNQEQSHLGPVHMRAEMSFVHQFDVGLFILGSRDESRSRGSNSSQTSKQTSNFITSITRYRPLSGNYNILYMIGR